MEYVKAEGESFFEATVRTGLEGMVAKRKNSAYLPGGRSRSWLKIKNVREQDFLVVGCTKGSGSRASTLGALVLGYREGDELRYTGRVGSGFDQPMLEELRKGIEEVQTDQCPFGEAPAIERCDTTWVRPVLVARVKFAEWTRDSILRAPVFLEFNPVVAE